MAPRKKYLTAKQSKTKVEPGTLLKSSKKVRINEAPRIQSAQGLALFDMKTVQDAEQIKRDQDEFKKTNVRSVMKLKQMKELRSQRKITMPPL